ncbi:hypothetical protein [Pseudoduganella umbonata]|uniref:Succinate dehydrogenase/fumarate reductase cytochrome b subunit n=1 Tax=Pseudoduganella umbonata TaxID=864828 RepID=A0A7W5E772_9BURK|nr:hypothetical protein [Pseudoduganella umbonata]MBB3219846.1 succinate dehydrogenase/fumarate reductase cytochrome b subunit [Pseudoduganella umbonata]
MSPQSAILLLHRGTGAVLAAFICLHLVNHVLLAIDPALAFGFMDRFRQVYRQPAVEAVLLLAVLLQLLGGAALARRGGALPARISGYYLLFFLLVHVTAVLWGRLGMGLDTDIRFAAAGLRSWPSIAFFAPYYFLAVLAVCFHVGLGVSRHAGARARTVTLAAGTVGLLMGTAIVGGMLALA